MNDEIITIPETIDEKQGLAVIFAYDYHTIRMSQNQNHEIIYN